MDNNLLFRRQFIVTNKENKIDNWQELSLFDDKKLYAHPDLKVLDTRVDDKHVIMLGFIIDPDNPSASDADIVDHLATYSLSAEDFRNNTLSLTGRWVLFFLTAREKIVINDPATARSIYYSDKALGTNSNIIDFYHKHEQRRNEDYVAYTSSKFARINEDEWYSDKTGYEGIYKLLPNHYLDLETNISHKHWIDLDYIGYDESIARAAELLKGSFLALKNRDYNYIQSLTAGFDSRVVYAATKAAQFDALFFLSTMNILNPTHPDLVIADQILKDDNKSLLIVDKLEKLDPIFEKYYKANIEKSKILPKTLTVQYFTNNPQFPGKILQITGNYSAVIKDNYKKNTAKDGPDIAKLIGIPKKFDIFDGEFDKWIGENKDLIHRSGIYMMDLFYWEHRLSNWGTNFIGNQDIAMDEFSPFNNREFYLRLMQAKKAGQTDHKKIFAQIIGILDPKLMDYPINPKSTKAKIQTFVKGRVSKRTWEYIKLALKR